MMIIECINCSKKFRVNSDQIPSAGRTIQCGSCNHVWFFNKADEFKETPSFIEENFDKKIDISSEKKAPKEIKDNFNKYKKKALVKYQKKSHFSFSKFLSYIFVFIISFISLIIVLDTFKTPLEDIFPGLELLLFNLFETLKDMFLFIKDLK
tara:strand:- start:849 stop:1304 length:456 start_codon:yes stop_codon:yes gene_type:complete